MRKFILLLIILLSFYQLTAQEEKTGRLAGKVTDKATGDPLPGVNIVLKGTYYGAATGPNGEFRIKNVATASYTIKVSLIGYKTINYTDVTVEPNKTKFLEIEMEETVLTMEQDVVVVGAKEMMDVEETQSTNVINEEDIKVSSVENVEDVLSQQAGVVKNDNSLHIRGGRSYESAYLLDGVSVQDPIAGTGFGLKISSNAIKEVEIITGGFNAEYGQATSGVVNVTTRSGSKKYTGYVSYKRDNFGNKDSYHTFNIDVVEANLSGPEPITQKLLPLLGLELPGKLTFFTSFYMGLSDGITQGYYKPTAGKLNSSIFHGTKFAPRAENNWFGLAKLNYELSSTLKLGYSFNQSVSINQNSQSLQTRLEYVEPSPGYQYEFQDLLENANVFNHLNKFQSISLSHTLNSKTFYELKSNYFFSNLRADANGKFYNKYKEPKDFPTLPLEYYNTAGDTIGVIPGDGFWDVGNPFTWHDHYIEEYSIKGDITSFFDEKNKFKAGFNMKFREMQLIDIYRPWIGELGYNNDIYKVHPAEGAFYAQDKITFSGMILNFGLRLDYWFPGKFVDDAVDNPDVVTIPDQIREDYKDDSFKWFGNRHFKARLSPRLGISHPVTNNQVLFFSYGHFSKWPRPQFVYAKLTPTAAQSTFQKFGNPNLKPETTVAYELGLKTQFTPNDVLTITAYYKDIFDYIRTRTAKISSPRFVTQNYITYVNQDYARSRGLEFEFKKRMGQWFSGSAYLTYSIVTGKSFSAAEGVLVLRGDLEESIKEEPMPWDRPITVSANLNFYINDGLFGFAPTVLDDIVVHTRIFYESGKRYTPTEFNGYLENGRPEYVYDRDERYSEIGDNWFWVNLNISKTFNIASTELELFVEINNLFDTKNSAIINPVTGEAYEYGDPLPASWNDPRYPDLQPPISPYPTNPARYLTRRNAKFGISLNF